MLIAPSEPAGWGWSVRKAREVYARRRPAPKRAARLLRLWKARVMPRSCASAWVESS